MYYHFYCYHAIWPLAAIHELNKNLYQIELNAWTLDYQNIQ